MDGLDAAWRESVGADPLSQDALAPTPTATFVPTYKPLSINPAGVRTAGSPGGVRWGLAEYLIILCICGLCCIPVIGIGAALAIGIAKGKK